MFHLLVTISYKYNIKYSIAGEGPGVQPAHDPERHGEDEGVPARPRDAAGPDAPHRARLPAQPRPSAHLAQQHGPEAYGGAAENL